MKNIDIGKIIDSIIANGSSPYDDANKTMQSFLSENYGSQSSQQDYLFWKKVVEARYGTQGFEERLGTLEHPTQTPLQRLFNQEQADINYEDWGLHFRKLMEYATFQPLEELPKQGEYSDIPLFPELLGPFIQYFWSICEQSFQEIYIKLGADTKAAATHFLLERLSEKSLRTVIWILGRSRLFYQLTGINEYVAYRLIMQQYGHNKHHWLSLLSEVPVLARILTVLTVNISKNIILFSKRLLADWSDIQTVFQLQGQACLLRGVMHGRSDPHDGQQSVSFVLLSDGSRLVYKPRSLEVDCFFQECNAWIYEKIGQEKPYAIRLLLQEDYGWCEWIERKACQNEEEIGQYFHRQSINLGLLFALGGSDYHEENIIPHGPWPIPVDLEGMLATSSSVLSQLDMPVDQVPIDYSIENVFQVTMLPRFFSNGSSGNEAFCVSTITGERSKQVWPVCVNVIENIGSINMHLLSQETKYNKGGMALPFIDNKKYSVIDYRKEFNKGFKDAYHAIYKNQHDFLELIKSYPKIKKLVTRKIIRDSNEYAQVLHWCTTPNILSSGNRYHIALENLCAGGLPTTIRDAFNEITTAEKIALWNQDIPCFNMQPTSNKISSNGKIIEADIFTVDGISCLVERVTSMSKQHLKWQLELIEGSLCLFMASSSKGLLDEKGSHTETHQRLLISTQSEDISPNPDDYQLLIRRIKVIQTHIVQQLMSLVRTGSWGSTWLTLLNPYRAKALLLTSAEVQSLAGNCGILLYLCSLQSSLKDVSIDRTMVYNIAESSVFSVEQLIDRIPLEHSGLCGLAATIYTICVLSRCYPNCELLVARIEKVVEKIPNTRWLNVPSPDFLTGSAGNITALCCLAEITGKSRYLGLAQAIAKNILAKQLDSGYWKGGFTVPIAAFPLTGAAHGASGIAFSLYRLSVLSPDPQLNSAIDCALAFEARCFNAEIGTWLNPDSATSLAQHPPKIIGWCAGASGIGLMRLHLHSTGLPLMHDICRAVEYVLHHQADVHNLCCGAASRLLFLAHCSRSFPYICGREEANQSASELISFLDKNGYWRLQSLNSRPIVPGLLDGASGIGIALNAVLDNGCAFNPLVMSLPLKNSKSDLVKPALTQSCDLRSEDG